MPSKIGETSFVWVRVQQQFHTFFSARRRRIEIITICNVVIVRVSLFLGATGLFFCCSSSFLKETSCFCHLLLSFFPATCACVCKRVRACVCERVVELSLLWFAPSAVVYFVWNSRFRSMSDGT